VNAQVKLQDVLTSVFWALAFLFWRGYLVNTADQGEHLPLVYKLLQPELYPVDFYVGVASEVFTIRFYYAHFLAFLGQWCSVELWSAVLNVFCLSVAITGWMAIGRQLTGGKGGTLAPFFIFFLFYAWTVGGNAIQYPLLISSTFAKAIAPWALWAALQYRWVMAGILLGLAGLFQVLVGLHLAMILGGLLLLTGNFRSLLKFSISFLLAVAPMLLPILYRQFIATAAVALTAEDVKQYYEILFRWRNPHHYLPSLFSLGSYIKLSILLLAGGLTARITLERIHFVQYRAFVGMILLGLILYSIALEGLWIPAVGKLQLFKTTIWLSASAALILSLAIEKAMHQWMPQKYFMPLLIFFPVVWILQAHIRHDIPLSFDHSTEAQKHLSELHQWIADSTPQHALFATYATNEGFICEAKRSQYVAWNPIVHEPAFLLEWFSRFNQLYQSPFMASDYKGTLMRADVGFEHADWTSLGITHLLIRKEVPVKVSHRVLQEKGVFKVIVFTN
jgi:hypothetical protein